MPGGLDLSLPLEISSALTRCLGRSARIRSLDLSTAFSNSPPPREALNSFTAKDAVSGVSKRAEADFEMSMIVPQ